MIRIIRFAMLALLVFALHTQSNAAEFKALAIYQSPTKYDNAFNQAAYNGISKFRQETEQHVLEYTIPFREDLFMMMNDAIVKEKPNVVLSIGFTQSEAVARAAVMHPDIHFVIIDVYWLSGQNIHQIVFNENEGGYLMGIVAAMASKTHQIGFIGGMDSNIIRKFMCGYVGGAKSINEDVKILSWMVGGTAQGFNDPQHAAELAKNMYNRGVDIIFHAAGGSGIGVIEQAKTMNKMVIGVDIDQQSLAPGHVVTSMIKHVDVAAYLALMNEYKGEFKAGVSRLGLANGGIDWVYNDYNKDIFSAEINDKLIKTKEKITNQEIIVHNYEDNKHCPY